MKHTNQVDIPLLFFSLGFFIILFGLFSKYTFQKKAFVDLKQAQISPEQDTVSKKLPVLNYNKPLMCNYSSKEASVSASVQDSSIQIKVQKNKTIQRYIGEGDCVYSWFENEKIGKKQCGVGQYITIGKQLLGSGLASADTLGAMASQAGKSIPFDLGRLMESCKNVKNIEKDDFALPKNVVFK